MRHYQPLGETTAMIPNGPVTDLGAEITDGSDPQTHVRVDWGSLDGPYCAGLWRCEAGTFDIDYPFTEHATLVEGDLTITDSAGNARDLKPGDAFLGVKGERMTWEIREPCVKSFLAIIESSVT